MLVFGLLMVGGFAHFALTREPYSPGNNHGASWVALGVMALYFAWCWSQGQTLAMKTWIIGVRDVQTGQPPAWPKALVRFGAAWLMVLPALGLGQVLGLTQQRGWIYLAVAVNVLLYAACSRWLPGRQFLHDRLAGTELVDLRAPRP